MAIRRTTRTVAASAVAVVFCALSIWNLCYPQAQGLSDQGDFVRIFASFSSGPASLAFWPAPDDPTSRLRFFHFYLRKWRLDGGVAPWPDATTSVLLYFPERLIRVADDAFFDLCRSTAYDAALLALLLFVCLRGISAAAPFLCLAFAALVLSDLRVGWMLNSFYEESGVYFFLLACFATILAWLDRPSAVRWLGCVISLGLLSGTKLVVVPSAVAIALGVIAWRLVRWGISLREAVVPGLVLLAAVLVPPIFQMEVLPAIESDVAFNFIFQGALPALPPERRAEYLAEIGLAEQSQILLGMHAYDGRGGEVLAAVKPKMGNALHREAIAALWKISPWSAVRLLRQALARSGDYDLVADGGYKTRELGGPAREAISFVAWSELRRRWLGGEGAYAALIASWLVLCGAAVRQRALRWSAAFATVGGGFLLASLVQLPIAIFGNGTLDLTKHLYPANLCFDFALFATIAGFAIVRRPSWDASLVPSGVVVGDRLELEPAGLGQDQKRETGDGA